MSEHLPIRVAGAGKKFRLQRSGTRSVKSAFLNTLGLSRTPKDDFWALRDVSFEVARGETLGIIGANGAGKSTLLSLLAGTKVPTEGSIGTNGKISSLLELGAGFHPDLTGRENVFLAGAVMGIPRSVMRERFESVVSFAGIPDFIDHPVKHYSSGMYVRLGFAVAVEVDPDILLIDEVLAVGDSVFQGKCLAKMEEFRERGKTMLIISHDLPTIQSISDRILLLEEGRVLGMGDPDTVVDQYQSLTRRRNAAVQEREWGTGEIRITGVTFRNRAGEETDKFRSGERLVADIAYKAAQRVAAPVFGYAVATESGLHVHGNNTQLENVALPDLEGEGQIRLTVDPLALGAGNYLFSFSVHSSDHKTNYHRLDNSFPIAVEDEKGTEGCAVLACEWQVP